MAGDYLEMRLLESSGTIGSQFSQATAEALAAHGLADAEADAPHDRLLLQISRDQDDVGALLCLRCRISHPLEAKVRALHRQFGSEHQLDLIQLASYALDDQAQLEIDAPGVASDPGCPPQPRPFTYAVIASFPAGLISPFTAEVLRTYDPSLCGLPHWARLKLQTNSDLKAYLREQGLLMISDWALLADSSARRVREAWIGFGKGGMTAEQAVDLHGAYKPRYREAKELYRQASGKGSGWQPDTGFLRDLAPNQPADTTTSQLKELAAALRQFSSGGWRRMASLDDERLGPADIADPRSQEEPDDGPSASELLRRIAAALERAMGAYLPQVLATSGKDAALLGCLWQGYGEGLTNRALAARCGTTVGTVSKKLRLIPHTTAIATAAARELCRQEAFADVTRSVEAAERLVEALRNHLTEPEREGETTPLRRWVRQHLSSS